MVADRHARAARADLDRFRRPVDGFRVKDRRRFVDLARRAIADLPPPLAEVAGRAQLRVAAVPPGDDVRLAALEPDRRRLWLYRRPVEARALGRGQLIDVLRGAVAETVATELGRTAEFSYLWERW